MENSFWWSGPEFLRNPENDWPMVPKEETDYKQTLAEYTRSIESIPVTRAALLQQIKRSGFQEVFTWGQVLLKQPVLPSLSLSEFLWMEEGLQGTM